MSRIWRIATAFAVIIAWFLPTQIATAAIASSESTSGQIIELNQTPRLHSADEDDDEDEDDEDEDDEDDEDESHEGRQVAPPPLVVKHEAPKPKPKKKAPSTGSTSGTSSTLGTSALGSNSTDASNSEATFSVDNYVTSSINGVAPKAGTTGNTGKVNPTQNEPVINSISSSSFSNPAEEFMHKAYFGIGVLGAAAAAMLVHTLGKARASRIENEEYDYQ